MKKLAALALTAALTLSLAACGSTKPDVEKPTAGTGTNGGADVVATASVVTDKYTNLDKQGLLDAIAAYSGVSVVATVNPDGSPNNAIFVPGAVDGYLVFGLAENATKANLLRDKQAVLVFDIPNTAAETKEGRHTGAVAELKLVEDQKIIDDLKAANSDRVNDTSVICEITEVRAVG